MCDWRSCGAGVTLPNSMDGESVGDNTRNPVVPQVPRSFVGSPLRTFAIPPVRPLRQRQFCGRARFTFSVTSNGNYRHGSGHALPHPGAMRCHGRAPAQDFHFESRRSIRLIAEYGEWNDDPISVPTRDRDPQPQLCRLVQLPTLCRINPLYVLTEYSEYSQPPCWERSPPSTNRLKSTACAAACQGGQPFAGCAVGRLRRIAQRQHVICGRHVFAASVVTPRCVVICPSR